MIKSRGKEAEEKCIEIRDKQICLSYCIMPDGTIQNDCISCQFRWYDIT